MDSIEQCSLKLQEVQQYLGGNHPILYDAQQYLQTQYIFKEKVKVQELKEIKLKALTIQSQFSDRGPIIIGTFVSNEIKRYPQIALKVDNETYVFGGYDGGLFKMRSIRLVGNLIEQGEDRHTNLINRIDDLTVNIWNSGNRYGLYSVEYIEVIEPSNGYNEIQKLKKNINLFKKNLVEYLTSDLV